MSEKLYSRCSFITKQMIQVLICGLKYGVTLLTDPFLPPIVHILNVGQIYLSILFFLSLTLFWVVFWNKPSGGGNGWFFWGSKNTRRSRDLNPGPERGSHPSRPLHHQYGLPKLKISSAYITFIQPKGVLEGARPLHQHGFYIGFQGVGAFKG